MGYNLSRAFKLNGIKVGGLCRPELRSCYVKRNLLTLCLTYYSISVVKSNRGRLVSLYYDLLVILGGDIKILDMSLGTGKKVYVTENSVKAEAVLILKIAARAPLIHLYSYGVFTLANVLGDIKLALKMCALCKAHVFSVYVKNSAGCNSLKYDVGILTYVGNIKGSFIHTHRVDGGNVRIVTSKGVVDIRVVGIFIAEDLPAGGNLYFVPSFRLCGDVGVGKISKAPFTV